MRVRWTCGGRSPRDHTRGPDGRTIRGDHTRGPYGGTIRGDHTRGPYGGTIRGDHTRGPYEGTIRGDHTGGPYEGTIRGVHMRGTIRGDHTASLVAPHSHPHWRAFKLPPRNAPHWGRNQFDQVYSWERRAVSSFSSRILSLVGSKTTLGSERQRKTPGSDKYASSDPHRNLRRLSSSSSSSFLLLPPPPLPPPIPPSLLLPPPSLPLSRDPGAGPTLGSVATWVRRIGQRSRER